MKGWTEGHITHHVKSSSDVPHICLPNSKNKLGFTTICLWMIRKTFYTGRLFISYNSPIFISSNSNLLCCKLFFGKCNFAPVSECEMLFREYSDFKADFHGQPGGPRLSALSLHCLWASREAGSFDYKDIGGIKWINKEGVGDKE